MNYLSAPPMRRAFTDDDGRPAEWTDFFVQLESLVNNLMRTGTTAQRPSPAPFIGFMHFDTTLGKPIWADSDTTWVDATGASV
ncbi:MAG: hypothetical protein HC794_01555 [Nitrospiraceae bacterium]|nr:hypothetical protein [Nitrospiraceae bacterium]